MFTEILLPANGGVVVDVDTFLVVDDMHLHGTVVQVGGGVHWVGPGSRVAFPRTKFTEFEVLLRLIPPYPSKRDKVESGNPEERTKLYLIDQRDIHALLEDAPVGVPASGSFDNIGR